MLSLLRFIVEDAPKSPPRPSDHPHVPNVSHLSYPIYTSLSRCAIGRCRTSLIINVEYNQLDPILRATISPEGDVNDEDTGLSPFPGNTNNLVFMLDPYIKVRGGSTMNRVLPSVVMIARGVTSSWSIIAAKAASL